MARVAIAAALALAGISTPAIANTAMLPVDPPAAPQEATASEEEVPVVETIAMEVERYRRMTVPVRIMGEGPYQFMVDTGAQATVLSTELADELQLFDRSNAMLIGMASERSVQTIFVPDFSVGSRMFAIRTAPLVAEQNIGGADGILGLDSLQDQRVLLDFETGVMSVTEATGPRLSGYDIVVRARERLGQLIIHRASIDGINVDIIIDTGAQGSVGNMELLDRLRRRQQIEDSVMTDVNGVQVTGETRLASRLELGRAQINRVVITFANSPTFRRLGLDDRPAMILGMSELRLFKRVAIDFDSRRVMFDLPSDVEIDSAFRVGEPPTRIPR